MRAFEFLLEEQQSLAFEPSQEEQKYIFDKLQELLVDKIIELKPSPETLQNLKEIEDILAHTSSQGRRGELLKQLHLPGYLNRDAIKLLSRYIMGIPASPEQKQEFVDLLRQDKLIDQAKLLSVGKHTIYDIVPSSGTNPFIRELIDDLLKVANYGVGKGEFFLSAFSPSIVKPKKGDLMFTEFGKNGIEVEVKTVDVGAGRFVDRNVKASANYGQLAKRFVKEFGTELADYKSPASGINLETIVDLSKRLHSDPARHAVFMEHITGIVKALFNTSHKDVDRRVGYVIENIRDGNTDNAVDTYVLAAYTNYARAKGFAGILMIDMRKEPIFVFVREVSELTEFGMWMVNKTPIYMIAKTPADAYPQSLISYKSHARPANAQGKVNHLNRIAATNPEPEVAQPKPLGRERQQDLPLTQEPQ